MNASSVPNTALTLLCQSHDQERRAARYADQQRQQTEHAQRMTAAADAYKEQALRVFPGTPEEFEAQWPTILAEWQRRTVVESQNEQVASMLASGRYHGF